MEFYFDVDGVILDFETAMIDYVRKEYIPDLPLDFKLKNWTLTDEFKDLDMMKVWNDFISSGLFSELKPLVDINRFNTLSENYPVYLVTNLPDDDYHYTARLENLEKLDIRHNGLFLAGHFNFESKNYPTKSSVIQKLHVEGKGIVFLDDHPKNCADVREHIPGSNVYMMSQPHNMNETEFDWERVRDWDQFFERIGEIEPGLKAG